MLNNYFGVPYKMKYLIVYMCENGIIGNVDCNFMQEPPTIDNIRDAEKSISKKYCSGHKVSIVNWLKIAE